MKKLLPLFIIGLSLSSFAQHSKLVTKLDRNNPFDSSVQKLTGNFQGNDPVAILRALLARSKASQKGEFETTPDYEIRLAKLKQQPYLGSLHLGSQLGFLLPVVAHEAQYDADAKLLKVAIPLAHDGRSRCENGWSSTDGINCRMLTLIDTSDSSTYVGQNGFGAKLLVVKYEGTRIGLDFETQQTLARQERIGTAYAMNFLIDRVEAIKMKANLRILILGRLSNMNFTEDYSKTKPTFDRPVEINTLELRLHLIIREVWFINGITGDIYGRLNQQTIDGSTK